MDVKLEYITPDAAEFIGRMAGICYAAKPGKEAAIRRATKCGEDGHLSTLRFAHAVFHISGISRVCSHQFVRSKHLDFLQKSQRYVKENDGITFTYPDDSVDVAMHYAACYELYLKLIEDGMKKEDARFVLPEATHTELNVVGNFQARKDFIHLRADKHAQKEIREVAITINNILAKECPELFKEM